MRRGLIRPCPFPESPPDEVFQRLEAGKTEFRELHWFMRWSEILDNVSCYAYLDEELVMVFAFYRPGHRQRKNLGRVFVARIPPAELATILQEATDVIAAEPIA